MRRKPISRQRRTFQTQVIANLNIRAPQVRVLTERGEMVGVLTLSEALNKAQQAEKDLVLINEKTEPPIAKIIDIAKYKYQLQQKKSESRKKSKAQDIKEVRFTPFMADGDFEARVRKVLQFLKKGDKVRLSLQFKGRTITKKEFGYDVFSRVINATQEFASIEIEPKLLGQKLIAQLMPIKTKLKDIKV